MIPLAYLRAGVAALACVVALRRPAMRPVALAMLTLALINAARYAPLPGLVDVVLWSAWPFVSAALSWAAWRRSWRTVATFGSAYAAGLVLAPWSWESRPLAYSVASTLPFVLAPCLSALAWLTAAPARPEDVPARRVAALLLLSACVDVSAAGALWWGSPWTWAAPLSWATWAAVGIVVAGAWKTKGPPPCE